MGFIDKVERQEGWHKWYLFGDKLDLLGNGKAFDSFPTKEQWDSHVRTAAETTRIVDELFFAITSDYISKTGYTQPNWHHFPPSMCKYSFDFSVEESKDLIMHYHTDYQQERAEEPGFKFGLTCTMYLNSDYEGGEISFKVFEEDGTYKRFDYKPQQGDVLVFPSGEPYYHGVKTVRNNYKYFLRAFWWWEFEGTAEWLENQRKHGEEQWAAMEKARWKAEFRGGMHVRND